MTFHIITIFSKIFDSYFNESILKRAQNKGVVKIKIHNLRDWTFDRHKTVDDKPFGGGAGMIMKADIICKAINDIKKDIAKEKMKKTESRKQKTGRETKVILFSAKGRKWDQQKAKKYIKLVDVIMVCGRYEGIDERVKKFVDEEISIGDYVLTGGEIPAMVIIDSIARLIPGVLGNRTSTEDESHTVPGELEYPQYTRPEVLVVDKKKFHVPKVLISGNHQLIANWRKKKVKNKGQ